MSICSPRERKTDVIQKCFNPPCQEPEEIWMANGLVNPCATVIFTVAEACTGGAGGGTVSFLIDKKTGNPIMFDLNNGETRALTIDQIDFIQFTCNGTTGMCVVDFCMILHYDCC